jgi:Rrf2 family protein
MLSNSCRYGIRAIIYIASQPQNSGKTGIKQISKDLGLPTPFLAKILQQLTKHKLLVSLKGPHGGFSLSKDPSKITLLDIVKIIDGEEIFTNCIMRNNSCKENEGHKCTLHDDYDAIRKQIIQLFNYRTVYDLVKKTEDQDSIII